MANNEPLILRLRNIPPEQENALLAAGMSNTSIGYEYDWNKKEHVFKFENEFKIFQFAIRFEQLKNL